MVNGFGVKQLVQSSVGPEVCPGGCDITMAPGTMAAGTLAHSPALDILGPGVRTPTPRSTTTILVKKLEAVWPPRFTSSKLQHNT